jgi:hypothetical protein
LLARGFRTLSLPEKCCAALPPSTRSTVPQYLTNVSVVHCNVPELFLFAAQSPQQHMCRTQPMHMSGPVSPCLSIPTHVPMSSDANKAPSTLMTLTVMFLWSRTCCATTP